MIYIISKQFLLENLIWFLVFVALVSYFINHFFSKKVLRIALRKRLFAEQSARSSHQEPTPAFGGISIFIVVMITLLLTIGVGFENSIGFTLASCFILFILGLKDDLFGVSPRIKFFTQILAAILFVMNPDFELGHLSGFIGIGNISSNWAYFIGIFFIVALVNAFNLIDGIDGLSGMTAIVSFTVFGVYFFVNDHYAYSIFCTTLIGALTSFLTFNFAKPGGKMFMGDSGALVVGFLIATFALHILELQPQNTFAGFYPKNAPLFVLSVLIIPVLDTARIILIRLSNGQRPWRADRSHLHHVLLDLGYNHKQATARLIGLQVFAIVGILLINALNNIALHCYLIALYLSSVMVFSKLSQKIKVETVRNDI